MFENNIILLNIFVDSIMMIKENNWIRTNQGIITVRDPYCEYIIMVMVFLRIVPYFAEIISS
jgi:hypothetical protein